VELAVSRRVVDDKIYRQPFSFVEVAVEDVSLGFVHVARFKNQPVSGRHTLAWPLALAFYPGIKRRLVQSFSRGKPLIAAPGRKYDRPFRSNPLLPKTSNDCVPLSPSSSLFIAPLLVVAPVLRKLKGKRCVNTELL
jgi:hypothetical protein